MNGLLTTSADDKKFWLALKYTPHVQNRIYKVVDAAGDPEAACELSAKELSGIGFSDDAIADIQEFRGRYDIEDSYAALQRSGLRILTEFDDEYPLLLKDTYSYPRALFIKGKVPEIGHAVSIVGARHASPRGITLAFEIACALAKAGVVVVSGGARGIDTAAHKGALDAGGSTIAVLGCGLDIVYPSENRKLFADILERGALISEFPPRTPPLRHHFPSRNRIVAGMTQAVVIVEAGEKSGALITADFALEFGREVCAFPGFIHSKLSKGTNKLIKQGAHLIESAEDILEIIGLDAQTSERRITLSIEDELVIESLGWESMTFDELLQTTSLPLATLAAAMMSLELSGLVKKDISGRFLRLR